MHETEVKIIEEDFGRIQAKLRALGAQMTFSGILWTIYIDTAERKFANAKQVLRLRGRSDKDGAVLCFKDTLQDKGISVYEEKEVWVEDAAVLLEIFKAAGFVIADEIQKARTTYQLDDAEMVFDKLHGSYEFVPEYMEIEGKDKATIEKYLVKLGIERVHAKAMNSHEIIEWYRKNR